jgi:hypothetical protein
MAKDLTYSGPDATRLVETYGIITKNVEFTVSDALATALLTTANMADTT